MRSPAKQEALLGTIAALAIAIAIAATATNVQAQDVQIDRFWQRQSYTKFYKDLVPFREQKGWDREFKAQSQLVDLFRDLRTMRDIASQAKPEELSHDKYGHELCSRKGWDTAYRNIKANSLRQEGALANVFLHSHSVYQRGTCAYGMFYFNDPQVVFRLISFLPGEPKREIREDGFRRALEYLRAHLPKSRPLNAKFPEGAEILKWEFNALPYMQLLDQESPSVQAEGLHFLAEVLRIRPDLGKAFIREVREKIPALLNSESKLVRMATVDFVAATDRKRGAKPGANATDKVRTAWLRRIENELFPPVQHVSTGRCNLHASEHVDELIAAGKRILEKVELKKGAKRVGATYRYGVHVPPLPQVLFQLGLPTGALIVGVNSAPVHSAKEILGLIRESIDKHSKDNEKHVKYLRDWKPDPNKEGDRPRGKPLLVVLVEYVHKGRLKMREYRYGLDTL